MTDDDLIRGSAWLALAAYASSVTIQLRNSAGPAATSTRGRWLWTTGCVLLATHMAFAYQFRLNWSHDAAYAHTARRTLKTVGLDWGGGVYFNDFLLVLWAADALWWWLAPQSRARRPRQVNWLIHGYFAFMAINAAVVFGSGPLRWIAAGVTGLLIVAVIVRWTRRMR